MFSKIGNTTCFCFYFCLPFVFTHAITTSEMPLKTVQTLFPHFSSKTKNESIFSKKINKLILSNQKVGIDPIELTPIIGPVEGLSAPRLTSNACMISRACELWDKTSSHIRPLPIKIKLWHDIYYTISSSPSILISTAWLSPNPLV